MKWINYWDNMQQQIFVLRIIFLGLITGPALFLAVTQFILIDRALVEFMEFVIAGAVVSIAAIAFSFLLPNFKDKFGGTNSGSRYTTYKIIQLAVLEGAALLNAVAFYLTGHPQSLTIGICLVLLMAIRFPSEAEMNKLFGQ
ncbi:MAG: hypothetical protein KDK41_05545 [Leptospiraceae bacterium]|nr:hypothetical protein [Leptospiraceae bacterium]